MTAHDLRRDARALIADIAEARRAALSWLPWDAQDINIRVAGLCSEAGGLGRGEAHDLIAALTDLHAALDDLAAVAQPRPAP